MDWNNSRYIERIREWRQHRDDIVALPFHEAVTRVAEFWGKVPIHTGKKVRIYEPDTWNTPWEILHENVLCENRIALMIYHTLSAAYADDTDVQITMRIAHYKTEEFLVVDVNRTYVQGDKFTLNYITGVAYKDGDEPDINFIHTFDEDIPHIRNK